MAPATATAPGGPVAPRSPGETFDIYQTSAGYVAVQPELQRKLLLELQGGDRSFTELVEASDRSKATVSVAIAELVEKAFVKETVPPDDRRRRVYTSLARRIGSSDIPLPDLRKAVQKYVRASAGPGYGLKTILHALGNDVPASAAPIVWTQAITFGRLAAEPMRQDTRSAWMKLGEHLESEGVGRMLAVDLRAGRMDVELESSLEPAKVAAALAGFAHGFIAPGGKAKVIGAPKGRSLVVLETT